MIIRNLLGRVAFSQTGLDGIDRRVDQTKGASLKAFAGIAMGAVGALGLASKALAAVDKSLDFSAKMGQINTLMPENAQRVSELGAAIEDMSRRSGESVGTLADTVYQVVSALGDTADTARITELAIKSAAAGGTDAATAFDLLKSVTRAYGDTSYAATQKVADLAQAAVSGGSTRLPELAAGMGQVSGAAVQLGVKQEELFAILATASGVTGPTNRVYTQLAATMANLSKPIPGLAKVYKQLGITSIQAAIAQDGLQPTLLRIIKATDGTSESVGKLFESEEARGLIMPLVTKLQAGYNDQMRNAAGASGKLQGAYKAQTEGAGKAAHQAKTLDQRSEALQRTIGAALTPMVEGSRTAVVDLAERITNDLLPAFAQWHDASTGVSDDMTSMDVAVKAIEAVFGGIAVTIDLLVTLMRSLGQAAITTAKILWDTAGGELSSARAAWQEGDVAQTSLWSGFGARAGRVGQALVDPEGLRKAYEVNQMVARFDAERAAAGGSSSTLNMNGNLNVTVPAGTPAQQAEQVADQALPEMLKKATRQALEANPNPARAGAR